MAKTYRFKLLAGKHVQKEFTGAKDKDGNPVRELKTYKKGDIVESPLRLDERFNMPGNPSGAKFELLHGNAGSEARTVEELKKELAAAEARLVSARAADAKEFGDEGAPQYAFPHGQVAQGHQQTSAGVPGPKQANKEDEGREKFKEGADEPQPGVKTMPHPGAKAEGKSEDPPKTAKK